MGYFNEFFYLLKYSSGSYVEIYKNKYYIRKYEYMCKEFTRFNMVLTIAKWKDNKIYLFHFFSQLVADNYQLQTIETIVLEPQMDILTWMYIDNEPIFNFGKVFNL